MPSFAQHERRALCDLFEEVGPAAPTCCEGWLTADLAAHLYLREHKPVAGLGIVVGALSGHTEKVQRSVRDGRPWPELVEAVRQGPPAIFRPFDEAMNTAEYFIHLEDVRRARQGWTPRQLEPGLEDTLYKRLKLMARGLQRRAPVPVVLETLGYGEIGASDRAVVTLSGPPSELVLFVGGRGAVARVEFSGEPAAVAQVERLHLSM